MNNAKGISHIKGEQRQTEMGKAEIYWFGHSSLQQSNSIHAAGAFCNWVVPFGCKLHFPARDFFYVEPKPIKSPKIFSQRPIQIIPIHPSFQLSYYFNRKLHSALLLAWFLITSHKRPVIHTMHNNPMFQKLKQRLNRGLDHNSKRVKLMIQQELKYN